MRVCACLSACECACVRVWVRELARECLRVGVTARVCVRTSARANLSVCEFECVCVWVHENAWECLQVGASGCGCVWVRASSHGHAVLVTHPHQHVCGSRFGNQDHWVVLDQARQRRSQIVLAEGDARSNGRAALHTRTVGEPWFARTARRRTTLRAGHARSLYTKLLHWDGRHGRRLLH